MGHELAEGSWELIVYLAEIETRGVDTRSKEA
jgi:hypothetical protein